MVKSPWHSDNPDGPSLDRSGVQGEPSGRFAKGYGIGLVRMRRVKRDGAWVLFPVSGRVLGWYEDADRRAVGALVYAGRYRGERYRLVPVTR